MSLLDGKYEVISQRPLQGGITLFDAIAPDGTPLRIEWFDLGAAEDAAFERHRRLLKRLKREEMAAVHDVISRPGARYVAWLKPAPSAAPASRPELERVLADYGYQRASADIRTLGPRRPPLLYGLGFDGQAAPSEIFTESETLPARPLRTGAPPLAGLERVPLPRLSWSVAAVLFLAALLLAFGAFQRRVVDEIITVPDVLGHDVLAAIETLSDLQLEVDVVPFASDSAAGTILATEPPVGTELRPGRRVSLTYARPPGSLAQTEAPGLVGLVFPDEVQAALAGAGLTLGEVARIGASTPAGIVLAQTAGPGERVGTGTPIDVLVSLGPTKEQTFLPDLVGLDEEDAIELALVAGLELDRILVDEVASGTGFSGEVLSQSLAPNVPVARADAILRLVVQAGPQTAAAGGAPDLVGLSPEEAERVAAAAGWEVRVERLGNMALPATQVVHQAPAPGQAAPEGSAGQLLVMVNYHPVPLRDPGFRAVVREPEPRQVAYAWSILPGIARTQAQVWAHSLDGTRTLVARPIVEGGEVLRGVWRTSDPGPITFELLLGEIPYGDPLLVP